MGMNYILVGQVWISGRPFDFMKHDFIFSPYMGKVLGDLLTLAKFHTENYGNSFILSFNVEEDSTCE